MESMIGKQKAENGLLFSSEEFYQEEISDWESGISALF